MFWKKKLSKTAKNTIVKKYGRLKGGRRKPPSLNTPLQALLWSRVPSRRSQKFAYI